MADAPASVQIIAEWDADAEVWVATSPDVPGLVVEHADLGELGRAAAGLVPLLLAENGLVPPGAPARDIPVHLAAHAAVRTTARLAA